MKFKAGTRTRLLIDMTLDFDPTGSTVDIAVDGTWHPAEWVGDPVQSGGVWTQTARTTGWFAGPGHTTPDGATVLTEGRHHTQTRVTDSDDTLPADSTPIDVQ